MEEYIVYFNGTSSGLHSTHPSNKIQTTKYSLISFVPKSIFHQFSRVANLYFLFTAIVMCIPSISPLNPFTAIGPLSVVLLMAMIKEGIEDLVISN